jgi:hypothetical protein
VPRAPLQQVDHGVFLDRGTCRSPRALPPYVGGSGRLRWALEGAVRWPIWKLTMSEGSEEVWETASHDARVAGYLLYRLQ